MLITKKRTTLNPESLFQVQGHEFTVSDFWQWAFSDLQNNITRGILAEFIVAKALKIPLDIRQTWDNCDLITENGIRIEVKASGYLQSWEQKKQSRITFGRLKGRSWTPEQGYSPNQDYRADIFVFCIQTAKDHNEYNPLDLTQWEFRIIPYHMLAASGCKSISYATVRKLAPNAVSFEGLSVAVNNIIQ